MNKRLSLVAFAVITVISTLTILPTASSTASVSNKKDFVSTWEPIALKNGGAAEHFLTDDISDPCGCDSVLMTARIEDSMGKSYRHAILSLATKESFENLSKYAGGNVGIGKISLGADWGSAKQRINNELSKYESNLDIREARSFVLNGVPKWATDAWRDCKDSCSNKKGLFVWPGYQSKDFVVIVVKWLPHVTPNGKVMEGKFNWDLIGGIDNSSGTNHGTRRLIGDDEFRLRFIRRDPTKEEFSLQWSGGGVEPRSGSISLPKFPLPPTEKIQRYTMLLTKIQGFQKGQEKDAKQTWSECVSLCDEIFALIKADFPSRMQDIFVIPGEPDDSISNQMELVSSKLRERIRHFDYSALAEAQREVNGWGGIAKKIMDEFQ